MPPAQSSRPHAKVPHERRGFARASRIRPANTPNQKPRGALEIHIARLANKHQEAPTLEDVVGPPQHQLALGAAFVLVLAQERAHERRQIPRGALRDVLDAYQHRRQMRRLVGQPPRAAQHVRILGRRRERAHAQHAQEQHELDAESRRRCGRAGDAALRRRTLGQTIRHHPRRVVAEHEQRRQRRTHDGLAEVRVAVPVPGNNQQHEQGDNEEWVARDAWPQPPNQKRQQRELGQIQDEHIAQRARTAGVQRQQPTAGLQFAAAEVEREQRRERRRRQQVGPRQEPAQAATPKKAGGQRHQTERGRRGCERREHEEHADHRVQARLAA